jgi:TatD DNase family protein
MTDNYAYLLDGALYINLTNACTNNCVFCIRSLTDKVLDKNLWLKNEKIASSDVIEQIKNLNPEEQREFVFCGYGEPMIKLDLIKEIASFLKKNYPLIPVRINTNGHGNLIHKRNIIPELKGIIDRISISLNAENSELYQEISQSNYDKNQAYQAVWILSKNR